jgi:metal-responsive CopG/Arc/MetJ family transcriptional regulator
MGNIGEENKQISITLPKYIVEKLELDAKKDVRKRSQQAAKIIIDFYESKNKDCQK